MVVAPAAVHAAPSRTCGPRASLPAADLAIEPGQSLPSIVDRWFAENTFDASEFRDLRRLVELKERTG